MIFKISNPYNDTCQGPCNRKISMQLLPITSTMMASVLLEFDSALPQSLRLLHPLLLCLKNSY